MSPEPRAAARLRDRTRWFATVGGRAETPRVSWSVSLGVFALALFLRLWRLGTPREFSFDETYYAKDAFSLWKFGYARGYVEGANDKILDGARTGLWTDQPSMAVHPEVGKWLIGLGEQVFGMTPFGWRVSAALVGSLMVLVMVRLARRLTGSTLLGAVGGLLLCFDGMQLVLSRLALLDIFMAFFVLLGVHLLVMDRDQHRARLAALVEARDADPAAPRWTWGPVRPLLLRPWLLTAGVVWGLAVGTKWTALYPLAVFGVLVWLWSAGARRATGVRWSVVRGALVDGAPAFLQLVVVAFGVYVATWTGWLVHAHAYEESLSSTQYTRFVEKLPGCDDESIRAKYDDTRQWPTATEPDARGPGEVVQSLRSLWYYHQDVLTFHKNFLDCAKHTYESDPRGWLLLNRPVGVSATNGIEPGQQGCEAAADSTCLRQVLLIGTPVLWWGGALSLLASVALWVGARDWRHGMVVLGALSTWLPWFFDDDRPIFLFYASAILPFTVLSLVLVMGRLIGVGQTGGTGAPSRARSTLGVVVSGSFLVLVVLNFAWFWPIWTDGLLTRGEWLQRIWFRRWI